MEAANENKVDVAKAVGVSHVAIGNYVAGRLPRAEELLLLAQHFKVSTDYLLGWEGVQQEVAAKLDAAGRMAEALGGTEAEKQERFNDLIIFREEMGELNRLIAAVHERPTGSRAVCGRSPDGIPHPRLKKRN
jgi:transcriptional regulator with XRE-family HTH domain